MSVSRGTRIWNGPAPVLPSNLAPWNADEHSGQRSWFKLRNLGGNAADLWIYSEIGMWGITAEGLVSELATLNVADITVHVNSPGGDVFDGIAIMNALRDHPARITVQVDALAASIASVIAQAGDEVIMGRNSMMMIHNASGFAMGEAVDLRKMADLLDSTTANIASIYAQRAGGTPAAWLKVMAGEQWYSAEEAVEAGLADSVAPLPAERGAHQQAARFDLSVYNHAPKIDAILQPAVGELGPSPWPNAAGCSNCSNTQTRETTDMVCLECGTDYAPDSRIPVVEDPAAPAGGLVGDFSQFLAGITSAVDELTPKPIPWSADLFRGAISLVTNDTPAPADTNPPEPIAVTGFMDPSMFAQAIREARA